MAEEPEKLHFFKANVKYMITPKRFRGDTDGVALSGNFGAPYEVPASKLREFKNANKRLLLEGLMVEVEEPEIDWETANQLTDDDIQNLLKTPAKLKSIIPTIDSAPILHNLLSAAKEKGSAPSVTKQIQDRLKEVEPDPEEIGRVISSKE